jgi:hypothetical protein
MLANAVGFELAHVPYGGPNGIQDLIGGRVPATMYPIGSALPYVQSGNIRALAITSTEWNRQLPEVATVREAGFPPLEAEAEQRDEFAPPHSRRETAVWTRIVRASTAALIAEMTDPPGRAGHCNRLQAGLRHRLWPVLVVRISGDTRPIPSSMPAAPTCTEFLPPVGNTIGLVEVAALAAALRFAAG